MNEERTRIYDYIIIGSGFGGSVSALRLAEKGYSVLVLEAGSRFHDHDFPKSNHSLRKWLFWPQMGFHGIMRMHLFRDAFFLAGAGVGGGSLVYANTLLRPSASYFNDPKWRHLGDWQARLLSHYETAERMLGVTTNTYLGAADRVMKELARELNRGDTFHQTKVGVFFGAPNQTVNDPYFGGAGPSRTGCTYCGNCMVGCRVGAKNTLVKNYLYFAEKLGVTIIPDAKAEQIRQHNDGTYTVTARVGTTFMRAGEQRSYESRGLILSAGVLGTVELLLRMKHEGYLSKLSPVLGQYVRTNSEALVGARAQTTEDFSQGLAINAGFYPNDKTHIEIVRYGAHSDMIGLITTLLVGGGPAFIRWAKLAWRIATNPIKFIKSLRLKRWANETIILLVMQTLDNHLKLTYARRWYWPFKKAMTTSMSKSDKVPAYLPIANQVAELMAERFGGIAMGSIPEILLNRATTAHILGGAIMGANPSEGVIDDKNRVFGYHNMYVIDGSMIPANLGVNPSLTITAMAEYAMSNIPPKDASDLSVR